MAQPDPSIPQDERGKGFDRLSPNGNGNGNGTGTGNRNEKQGNGIRDRAFSGSAHKFPEPAARPAGAALSFAAKL